MNFILMFSSFFFSFPIHFSHTSHSVTKLPMVRFSNRPRDVSKKWPLDHLCIPLFQVQSDWKMTLNWSNIFECSSMPSINHTSSLSLSSILISRDNSRKELLRNVTGNISSRSHFEFHSGEFLVLLSDKSYDLRWGITDLLLHFFYFESILVHTDDVAKLDKNTFVALGMTMGESIFASQNIAWLQVNSSISNTWWSSVSLLSSLRSIICNLWMDPCVLLVFASIPMWVQVGQTD